MKIKNVAAGIIVGMIFFSGCDNSTEEASRTALSAASLTETASAAEKIPAISSDKNVTLTGSDAVRSTAVTTDIITENPDVEINETVSFIENDKNFITPSIIMVQIYENYAWGFEQEITVIDSDGSYYYFEHSGEGSYDPERISLSEDDDWYDVLIGITESENSGQIGENIFAAVREFSDKFEQYGSYPVKEYSSGLRDYGTESLYGIYIDKNNVPQYVKLSQYGNNIKCIDNDEVVEFVNQMIDAELFCTGEFRY